MDDYITAGEETERPPITAYLRDRMQRYNKYSSMTMPCDAVEYVRCDAESFDAACDAVDSLHAALEREVERRDPRADFQSGYERALEEMADGFTALPRDADGLTIHIGDTVQTARGPEEVEGILPDRVLVLRDGEWLTIDAALVHHAAGWDSWERIIEDALGMDIYSDIDTERLVERCRALAGER